LVRFVTTTGGPRGRKKFGDEFEAVKTLVVCRGACKGHGAEGNSDKM